MSDATSATPRFRYLAGIIALLICLLTFLIYTPALKNEFVNWDDDKYVYENSNIQSLSAESLTWMFSSFYQSNWHPLTWLSHAADYAFWGYKPLGHHLTSILLHVLNTLLIFLLCVQLVTRSAKAHEGKSAVMEPLSTQINALMAACVTSLLFGIHPVHVESVAWVAERKDLLCAFFALLSIMSYLSYTSSIAKSQQQTWFTVCLLLFIFALMSKPMAVTLPVVLLLLDIYPLKRISRYLGNNVYVLLEKIPFFILSITSSIITVVAQHSGGAIRSLEMYSLDARFINALRSLVFYLEKIIVPVKLLPLYPFPTNIHWLDIPSLTSIFLFIAITGAALWMAKKGKYLILTAWLYYLVTLLPVLGIIQVGKQAAADRYAYLPGLSPFFLAGVGTTCIWGRTILFRHVKIPRMLVPIAICSVMCLLGYLTVQQIKIWHNSEVMWKHVIEAFPKAAPTAYNNLGCYYVEIGMLEDAANQFKQAITISTNYSVAYNNLAEIYATAKNKTFRNGREAIALAIKACTLTQFKDYRFLNTLAAAYAEAGFFEEAIEYQKRVIDLSPREAKVALFDRLKLYQSGQPYRSQ